MALEKNLEVFFMKIWFFEILCHVWEAPDSILGDSPRENTVHQKM